MACVVAAVACVCLLVCARECLRLNSGDNQGVRLILSVWLLERNELDAAQQLLDKFPRDPSATVAWNRALLLFKRGDRDGAVAAVRAAARSNRLVRLYLLGLVAIPEEQHASIAVFGDEAEEYARDARHLWQQTPGSLEWLATIQAQSQTGSSNSGLRTAGERTCARASHASACSLL